MEAPTRWQQELIHRVAAQRGLVEYIGMLNAFAGWLRENNMGVIADEMKRRGLDPVVGYDPDKDPEIQVFVEAGLIGRNPRYDEVREVVREMLAERAQPEPLAARVKRQLDADGIEAPAPNSEAMA